MTNLSPVAQAVRNAYHEICEDYIETWLNFNHNRGLAAALRAAADQVVPKGPKPSANSDYHLMNWTKSLDQYYQRQQTREELLAIAAELEANAQ